ncbi:MAG: hypothetical protein ACI9J3_000948 [Parvicellaceae bacterium]
MENEGTLEALCALVPIEAEKNRTKATNHITAIRQIADDLNDTDPGNPKVPKLNKFCDFFQTYIEIRDNEGSLFNLTKAQEQVVRSVAAEESAIAIKAQTMLKLIFGEYFDRPGEDLISLKSAAISQNIENVFEFMDNKMKAYPNPTEGWVTIELPEEALFGQITVVNIIGQQIIKHSINETIFSEDLGSLEKGLYLISVTCVNGDTYLQKIVLE